MSEVKPAPALDAKKSSKTNEKVRRTISIELKLFEPTADDYPEFYIPELLYKERMKAKKAAQPEPEESFGNPFNHDSDDDEDVQRLTKKMNEKYGNGSGYEINDKAAGYDESDSFIDNTEAFDEMIVDDTPRGGFYINSGPLVFKNKEKSGIAGGKKRTSLDTEDEAKAGKKKFQAGNGEHKPKKKKKEVEENRHAIEKGKTMAIKDVLRLQRDKALKNVRRVVSDEEDSDDSGSSQESSEDSDVKIVDPTPLPPGIPESAQPIINDFKDAIEKHDDDKFPDLRARVDAQSLAPEVKTKIHSYLTSLLPAKPPPPPAEPKDIILDLPLLD